MMSCEQTATNRNKMRQNEKKKNLQGEMVARKRPLNFDL